jgi:pyruvate formate lyase activating enzyme
MTSEEVVEEAWKYRTWMNTSGGGITLSGGEPLFQPEFTLDIIRRAHKKKMKVAIDTSGFGNLSQTGACLEEADLILLDIKTPLTDLHKELTGIKADQPRATLEYLKKIGKPMWIRHVVVPGITDREKNLTELKNRLMNIPTLEKFEFLPFHKMGEEKWEQEGLPYSLGNTPAPENSFMDAIIKEFSDAGIPM